MMNSMGEFVTTLEDIKEEYLEVYEEEYGYDINKFIGELEKFAGRKIKRYENLDIIINAHLDEIASNIAQDNYSEDILFFMVFYFRRQLGRAFTSLSEEEYLEIANRNYNPFILSILIKCIMVNLTAEDAELIIKLIDRVPFVNNYVISTAFSATLDIEGLSESVILKLRETIVRNGGVDWEKNESVCQRDDLMRYLKKLIDEFNEYIAGGKYDVEFIDLYAIRSDAKELLDTLDAFDESLDRMSSSIENFLRAKAEEQGGTIHSLDGARDEIKRNYDQLRLEASEGYLDQLSIEELENYLTMQRALMLFSPEMLEKYLDQRRHLEQLSIEMLEKYLDQRRNKNGEHDDFQTTSLFD